MGSTGHFSGIDPSEDLTLSVGWRSGLKLKLAQVPIGPDVASTFREVIADTLDNLAQREREPWTPEADESPETYLTLPRDMLGDAPILASEHAEQGFVRTLTAAESLPIVTPASLPTANLELYALTLGSVPGSRTVFVRRTNPRRGLRAGRMLTALSDTLTRIEEPVFGFDLAIDLVLDEDHVHVLSQAAFRALFRDQEALKAQVPTWTVNLSSHLPISVDGLDRLASKALRDRRIAGRLETIVSRGHLDGITVEKIRGTMTAVGLDPDALLDQQGQLQLEEEQIPTVLQFLNEDLFFGAITNMGFRADKKAAR